MRDVNTSDYVRFRDGDITPEDDVTTYIPSGGIWTAKDLVRAKAIASGHVTADYEETCNLLDGAQRTIAALIRALEESHGLEVEMTGHQSSLCPACALLAELKK